MARATHAGGRPGTDSPPSLQKVRCCHHLDLRFPASRAGRESVIAALSHPVCGHLLQQPWERGTQCTKPWRTDVFKVRFGPNCPWGCSGHLDIPMASHHLPSASSASSSSVEQAGPVPQSHFAVGEIKAYGAGTQFWPSVSR